MALNLYFAHIFAIYAHRNLKYGLRIFMCFMCIYAGQVLNETKSTKNFNFYT